MRLPGFSEVIYDVLTVKKINKAALRLSNALIEKLRKNGTENYAKTEVFLMLDIGSTNSSNQTTPLFIEYYAFAIALSVLRIPTNLSIFSDQNIQVEIKSQDNELEEIDLHKVLDTLSIKRDASDLVKATEFIKGKFSHELESHSLFVFTDGILVNNVENLKNLIQENTSLTALVLPQNDAEIINKVRSALLSMKEIKGFDYFILESENDIYESKESIISSFVAGIKCNKSDKTLKGIAAE